jgi:hypothetical protein
VALNLLAILAYIAVVIWPRRHGRVVTLRAILAASIVWSIVNFAFGAATAFIAP